MSKPSRLLKIAHRVGHYLERQGWLERDAENDYLALGTTDDRLSVLQSLSISYRIALGPQARRKVFTLQTLPLNETVCRLLAELRSNEPRITGAFCFCSTVAFVTHTSLLMNVNISRG